jgi:hypothetical protein
MPSPPESDQSLKRELSAYNKETLAEFIQTEGIPLDFLKVIDAELEGVMDHFTDQVNSRLDSLDSRIDTVLVEIKHLQTLSESKQTSPQVALDSFAMNESFWRRGNRIISFASGGAFLGGFIAQLPGAVLGVIAGTVLGLFIKVEPAD